MCDYGVLVINNGTTRHKLFSVMEYCGVLESHVTFTMYVTRHHIVLYKANFQHYNILKLRAHKHGEFRDSSGNNLGGAV